MKGLLEMQEKNTNPGEKKPRGDFDRPENRVVWATSARRWRQQGRRLRHEGADAGKTGDVGTQGKD